MVDKSCTVRFQHFARSIVVVISVFSFFVPSFEEVAGPFGSQLSFCFRQVRGVGAGGCRRG